MQGKTQRLTDSAGYTSDVPATGGLQLRSRHDPNVARLPPDQFVRLFNQLGCPTTVDGLRRVDVRMSARILGAPGSVDGWALDIRAAGDDYHTEPTAAVELIAGIEVLLRRAAEGRVTLLRVGPLELDLIERTAKRGDRTINLLPREFRLLEYMMRRKDQTLTRALLLQEVWNYKFVPETNLVDVHMGRLRRKVNEPCEPQMIFNVRGVGFILRAPA